MKLNDIQEKINNKEISIDGANYYLLTLIAEELKEIKEFLKTTSLYGVDSNKVAGDLNITKLITKKGVKNGK